MMKIIILTLCLILVSVSEAKTIKSASELIKWFNTKSSIQEPIELGADIDFSKTNLKYPLGVSLENGECTSFSGTLNGNGHSIKGLKMDNSGDSLYPSAGLFCDLKQVNISDLIIDESCEFKGVISGAVSVKMSSVGDASFNQISNKANVIGSQASGGFIGSVQRKVKSELTFTHCFNHGNVSSSGNNTGGFIGDFTHSLDSLIYFVETTNNGEIHGIDNVGGFVGGVFKCSGGGVIFKQSSNMKTVIGNNYVGGFVGFSCVTEEYSSVSLNYLNVVNMGDIQAKEMACGLYCLTVILQYHPHTYIFNAINHGSISGKLAFGITPRPQRALNVVNLGHVSGDDVWSLWDIVSGTYSVFSLNTTCQKCKSATRISYDSTDETYYVSGTKMSVVDMLNWIVMDVQNWKNLQFWGRKLEFIEREGELSFANRVTGHFALFFTVFIIISQLF